MQLDRKRKLFHWYRSENYDATRKFTALDWWCALAHRQALLTALSSKTLSERQRMFLTAGIKAIRKDPTARRIMPTLPNCSVRDTTIVEWRRLSGFHEISHIRTRVDAWFERYGHLHDERYGAEIYSGSAPRLLSLHELSIRYLGKSRAPSDLVVAAKLLVEKAAIVTVDLSAPDKVIEAEFKLWLSQKRSATQQLHLDIGVRHPRKVRNKEFTLENFETWSNIRVLDFLDIKISCAAESMRLPTNPILGELLLRNYERRKLRSRAFKSVAGVDEADVIRTQTKKTAEYLLAERTLAALLAQGITEWRLSRVK